MELAVSMFGEHVAMYQAEEDPAKQGQHEAALRVAISTDVTVREALSEVWELGIWLVRQLLGPKHEEDMARTVQVRGGGGGGGSSGRSSSGRRWACFFLPLVAAAAVVVRWMPCLVFNFWIT